MEVPSKEALRRALLEKRALLSEKERASAGDGLAKRFFSEVPPVADIGLYASFRGEAPTEGILRRLLREGRRVYLPRLRAEGVLEFAVIEGEGDLEAGPFGIPQPKAARAGAPLERIPLLLIPGVAFDLRGGRIGWGKGYYDSALQGYRGRRLALATTFR